MPRGSKDEGGWSASEWLSRDVRLGKEFMNSILLKLTLTKDQRYMAQYMQFAAVAAREALDDAGWHPEDPKEQDMTVSLLSIHHFCASHFLFRVYVSALESVALRMSIILPSPLRKRSRNYPYLYTIYLIDKLGTEEGLTIICSSLARQSSCWPYIHEIWLSSPFYPFPCILKYLFRIGS